MYTLKCCYIDEEPEITIVELKSYKHMYTPIFCYIDKEPE